MAKRSLLDTIITSIRQITDGTHPDMSGIRAQRMQAARIEIEHAVIVLSVSVIRIDAHYDSATETALLAFLDKHFGAKTATHRHKQIRDYLLAGSQPFVKMACQQIKAFTDHDSQLEIIRLLYGLATADAPLHTREKKQIDKIADYLELPEADRRAIHIAFQHINDPFALLEIEETDSLVKVKAAYRKMVLKHHPDRLASSVSQVDANIKFREIKKAYDTILQQRFGIAP